MKSEHSIDNSRSATHAGNNEQANPKEARCGTMVMSGCGHRSTVWWKKTVRSGLRVHFSRSPLTPQLDY